MLLADPLVDGTGLTFNCDGRLGPSVVDDPLSVEVTLGITLEVNSQDRLVKSLSPPCSILQFRTFSLKKTKKRPN